MGASPMLHGRGARATFIRVPMSRIPIHLTTPSEERARHVSSLRSTWDIPLITLAFLHGLALLLYPSPFLIALGMWWSANTIAHNFIHRPFFTSRLLNRLFSFYLSLFICIPQTPCTHLPL